MVKQAGKWSKMLLGSGQFGAKGCGTEQRAELDLLSVGEVLISFWG